MLSIVDLKAGTIFSDGKEIWQVLSCQHSKTGRAGAILRTKLKNLKTGAIVKKTLRSAEKFSEVRLERKKARYLYDEGDNSVFMDAETYEQFGLEKKLIGPVQDFIKEGGSVRVVFFDKKPLLIDLPAKVELRAVDAPKADKGNTATAATKKVTLETGLVVDAPLFIKEGENVVVDTRSGSYVERA